MITYENVLCLSSHNFDKCNETAPFPETSPELQISKHIQCIFMIYAICLTDTTSCHVSLSLQKYINLSMHSFLLSSVICHESFIPTISIGKKYTLDKKVYKIMIPIHCLLFHMWGCLFQSVSP